jgi:hypothetical protein
MVVAPDIRTATVADTVSHSLQEDVMVAEVVMDRIHAVAPAITSNHEVTIILATIPTEMVTTTTAITIMATIRVVFVCEAVA